MDADVASFVERHDGFSLRSEVSSTACLNRRVRAERCQAQTGGVSGMALIQEYHPIFVTADPWTRGFQISTTKYMMKMTDRRLTLWCRMAASASVGARQRPERAARERPPGTSPVWTLMMRHHRA
jgi:hypothetical protein